MAAANTGIILRRNSKENLILSPPVVGEIVYALDTQEYGVIENGVLLWGRFNPNSSEVRIDNAFADIIAGATNVHEALELLNDHGHEISDIANLQFELDNRYTQIQTNDLIAQAITGTKGEVPGDLNTLSELARAIGFDPEFSVTTQTSLDAKLDDSQIGVDIQPYSENLGTADRLDYVIKSKNIVSMTYDGGSQNNKLSYILYEDFYAEELSYNENDKLMTVDHIINNTKEAYTELLYISGKLNSVTYYNNERI